MFVPSAGKKLSIIRSAGKRFLLPDPTRTRGLITRPVPNPRVRVGLGKPADTGPLVQENGVIYDAVGAVRMQIPVCCCITEF